MVPSRDIADLLAIMARLRHPTEGCPWDVEQTFRSIVPYTLEEAYEVADAVERGDFADLRDELGDLLLQVVFQARMAEEQGLFGFPDVVEAITAKLIRRHPHIFGTRTDLSPAEVKALWAEVKAAEKRDRAATRGAETSTSLLDAVPVNLPALAQAHKLQARAATVGFDWNDARLVIAKIREELDEVTNAMAADPDGVQGEIGDLLFAVVNLARHVQVDPEAALRQGNAKFRRRFSHIERVLDSRGQGLADASLETMEALWQDAKQREAEAPF